MSGKTCRHWLLVGLISRWDLSFAEEFEQGGIFDGAYAVADAVRLQLAHGAPDAGGAHRLAGVGHAEQARFLGGGEGVGERLRRRAVS
jgi:hypothetical protein